MGKVADRYLGVDPWCLVEEGFHPDRSRASESVFSLANEHHGVRGYFEEGYSGDTLVGSYVNGVTEVHRLAEPSAYRGISDRITFVVNTVDWLYARIELGGERLDLARSQVEGFRRTLDFRTGELVRELVWVAPGDRRLKVRFGRFLSLERPELGYQRISLEALDFSGRVRLTLGLDFSAPHESYEHNFWSCPRRTTGSNGAAILGRTDGTGRRLFAGFLARGLERPAAGVSGDKLAGCRFELDLEPGRPREVERICLLATPERDDVPDQALWADALGRLADASPTTYAAALEQNARTWAAFWDRSDIEIDGDPETQQGIRFCLFQLHQTYRGAVPGTNIGAKGLSGEAYNGNAFWDSETYCLPFYMFGDPAAAKALLEFRYRTLPQAIARAQELDCEGACFPIATCDGTESCTLWQHASLQLQPTTAVAYGIWHYARVTGDKEFLYSHGTELLVQICRFLASRGQWSPRRRQFGFYAVMGPDEFQMMVNNNAYTNYMAKRTFEYTLEVLRAMEAEAPERRAALVERLGCSDAELERWGEMAERMSIPYDPATGLFEQHEGFFDLPHVDVDAIPTGDFPLYSHWSYDRIYRNDMIKQPDVLMFMLLYDGSFTAAEKRANYDYYEPRCIHESSLSPSVHSILASELGRDAEAFEFFRFATRIDLDDYNRNVREGVHMTSIAAAWMNIVYGFGGLRSDGEMLGLDPAIPDAWQRYAFQLAYRGTLLQVEVTRERAFIRVLDGPPVELLLAGRPTEIGRNAVAVPVRRGATSGIADAIPAVAVGA